MSEAVGRFVAFNLAPSLAAGVWATLAVALAAALSGLRSAETRNELMLLPLIKSTLVLLGVATAMPLPPAVWSAARAEALPFGSVAPWLVIWAGVGWIGFDWLRRRAGGRVVAASRPAAPGSRAAAALKRLQAAFAHRRARVSCPGCELPSELVPPRLYLSDELPSPALVLDRPPRLVLPRRLEAELDGEELEGVLAHELAHLWLRRPCGGLCDSARMRSLALFNPTGLLLGGVLSHQEELACDEIASGLTGRPEALASALLKTYRHRQRHGGRIPGSAIGLLGGGRRLSRRLRRLLDEPRSGTARPRVRALVALVVAIALIFLEPG